MIAARSSTVAYPPPVWPWPHLFVLLSVLLLQPVWMVASLPVASTPSMPNVAALPLTFVPNMGQFDPVVQAEARTPQATMSFAATEVTFALPDSTLRLQFQGANPYTEITGTQSLPGVVNYLYGNDAAHWQRNVPTYAGMTYQSLYPGIDLQYDGQDGNVKGTYTVAPGADPQQIRWRYQGTHNVRIDTAGNVQVAVADQVLTESAPVVWQTIAGRQVPVAARYVLAADGTLGFALGAYNAAYPLVIDPVLAFSTYLGGSEYDYGYAIATDGAGNAYVTGKTKSANFPVKNPLDGTLAGTGTNDAFIAKYGAQGGLVYATYFGGSSEENNVADKVGIAVDGTGNVYVAGSTQSTNFPVVNANQPVCKGTVCSDAFVAKLNAQGSAFVYATYLGGDLTDYSTDIAVDSAGNAYVAGNTGSKNFPLLNPADSTQAGTEGFVTKFNATGSAYVFSTYLGGSGSDYSAGIALDNATNVYITGGTTSTDFPTRSPRQAANAGSYDGFVTELSAAGNALVFSTYLGGTAAENVDGKGSIAVDNAGNIYVTGETRSANFPLVSALDSTFGTDVDAFVAKYAPGGSAVAYATYLGGTGRENYYARYGGIAVNSAGNAVVTGQTCAADFPTKSPLQEIKAGTCYAFVTQINAQGSAYVFSTGLGGFGDNGGYDLALDRAGNIWVTGMTNSLSFPLRNATQQTNGGRSDAFIAKISPTANLVQNAGFELDANADGKPDNWTAVPQVSRSSAQKRSGTFSMQHRASDNSNYVVEQTLNVAAGHTYGFSGWVNVPATADAFTFALEVQWRNNSNAVVGTSPIKTYTAATNGWNNATAALVTPAGATKASVRMVVTSLNATVYVDDVVLKP